MREMNLEYFVMYEISFRNHVYIMNTGRLISIFSRSPLAVDIPKVRLFDDFA